MICWTLGKVENLVSRLKKNYDKNQSPKDKTIKGYKYQPSIQTNYSHFTHNSVKMNKIHEYKCSYNNNPSMDKQPTI